MIKLKYISTIILAMFIIASCSDEPWQDMSDTTESSTRTDANEATHAFYRNHAIGYSYNALEGEYCNPNDVRCQIINRKVLEQAQKKMGVTLFNANIIHKIYYHHEVYTSVVNYAQNANVGGGVSGGILLFHGSVQKDCSIFEDGTIDTYILHDEMTLPMAEYTIETRNLKKAINNYPNILTSSFRSAVDKLKQNLNDSKALENFIDTYGTHVVTYVSLGAKLCVDVQVETQKFNTQLIDSMVAKVALGTLFQTSMGKSKESNEYAVLKDNHCRITAMGGDVSILDSYISMSLFDASNAEESDLKKWTESIKFDDENMANSNVEVFEMKVVPIWDFIADEQVAANVATRIKGDAASLQKLLGNRNFINTSFEAHPIMARCKVLQKEGKKKFYNFYKKSDPRVVDIIAANRHVATVCKEYVTPLKTHVFVAYPIYEGRMKMTDGLCIYKDSVYSVGWRYGHYIVKNIGTSKSDSIYINAGVLSASRQDGLEYQTSHAMLGAERPGAISKDGTPSGIVIPTTKRNGYMFLADFYFSNDYIDGLIRDYWLIEDWSKSEGRRYDNLPGWEFMKGYAPEEGWGFAPHDRMKRKNNYIYIYNPNEIDYY